MQKCISGPEPITIAQTIQISPFHYISDFYNQEPAPYRIVTKLFLRAHVDICGGITGLKFGLGPYLGPYFVNASSEGSTVSVHLHRLVRGFDIW